MARFFFIVVVFSSAQLVLLQAPKHRPIISPRPVGTDGIPERHQRQWIYKTAFTNLCLELQQNRSWIKGVRQKSIHSFHSIPFTHSLTAVPFVRGHRSVFPRTPRNTRVYTRHPTLCHSHEWRVDTASGLTLKKQNACLHMRSEKKLRVYTASEAKGLKKRVTPDSLLKL